MMMMTTATRPNIRRLALFSQCLASCASIICSGHLEKRERQKKGIRLVRQGTHPRTHSRRDTRHYRGVGASAAVRCSSTHY
ncbi:uncharacterized protein B0I36DRAFT_317923 [Microdochium trichocladiopsis]|uniref:Uncharacterized protein n=1 Tax=Microdochium trichocladiopsis TaxID=1682393 RepID=A0A9P9BWM7_9PEZI|nr:uncharacterized protein B0I36DRAFT_317923 [Microdochium trichocladiopsis]KAH7035236.1 hypothetical protein B0I36DRAFT_317923 [Microdochium trichocladiopsis]